MYRGFEAAAKELQAQTAPGEVNRALQFMRFYPYQAQNAEQRKKEKSTWLQQFVGAAGDAALLHSHYQARLKFAGHSAGQAQVLEFDCAWRFVSGCGDPHPVENGFAWHPSLSVPYLPASSLKGLARAFASAWLAWPEQDVRRIFGGGSGDKNVDEDEGAGGAGTVIFFDLLPTRPVRLMVDVMTPHHGQWSAQGGKIQHPGAEFEKLPAPWHNPVPVPFLVVDGGHFHLLLQARGSALDDLHSVAELLPLALEVAGAGAKTSSAYGRFQRDNSRQEEEQRQAALAAARAQQQAKQEEQARQRQLPDAEKLAAIMQDLRKKAAKELAVYLCSAQGNKKLGAVLQQQGLSFAQLQAALLEDAQLLKLLRSWNGKPGDEGRAYAMFALSGFR